jgi:hypothetical protein
LTDGRIKGGVPLGEFAGETLQQRGGIAFNHDLRNAVAFLQGVNHGLARCNVAKDGNVQIPARLLLHRHEELCSVRALAIRRLLHRHHAWSVKHEFGAEFTANGVARVE